MALLGGYISQVGQSLCPRCFAIHGPCLASAGILVCDRVVFLAPLAVIHYLICLRTGKLCSGFLPFQYLHSLKALLPVALNRESDARLQIRKSGCRSRCWQSFQVSAPLFIKWHLVTIKWAVNERSFWTLKGGRDIENHRRGGWKYYTSRLVRKIEMM